MVVPRFTSATSAVFAAATAACALSIAVSGPAWADTTARSIAIGVIDGQLITNLATGDTLQDAKAAAVAGCQRNGATQCSAAASTDGDECLVVLGEADGSYAGGSGTTITAARQDALANAAQDNTQIANTAPILTSSCP